jgi:hypothetical protein
LARRKVNQNRHAAFVERKGFSCMGLRIPAALVVLTLLVSGCSSNEGPSDGSTSTTTSEEQIANAADLPGAKIKREPREIYNETFRYKSATGGQDIAASFQVDNVTTTLGFRMLAYGDCPAYMGRQEPKVMFSSPSNATTEIRSFGGSSGTGFDGLCNPGQVTGQQYLGSSEARAQAELGEWTVRSQGTFTGNVRLIVTADPAEST